MKHEPPMIEQTPERDHYHMLLFRSRWNKEKEENDALLEELKSDFIDGPMLQRPNSSRQFFLKTDWCKYGMGATLMQEAIDPD